MKLEERLQIRVSKKMMEGLEQEAARRGVKVSDLVRMAGEWQYAMLFSLQRKASICMDM